MTTPDAAAREERLAHRTTIDTILTLADLGAIDEAPTALYTIGIRPPARYLDEQRRRFPNLYAAAEDLTPTDEEPLALAALFNYVDDVTDLEALIRRLREDPREELDRLGILEDLNPHAHLANVAEDVAEEKQDELDALLAESYQPTRDARLG